MVVIKALSLYDQGQPLSICTCVEHPSGCLTLLNFDGMREEWYQHLLSAMYLHL